MSAWRIFARFLARLFTYFNRRKKQHRRRARYGLVIGALESREPPSDAISSLHPVGLLADIGIDPFEIVPKPFVPPPEPISTPPSPKTEDDAHHTDFALLDSSGQLELAQSAPSLPIAIDPIRTTTFDADLSIDLMADAVPPFLPVHPERPGGGEGGGGSGDSAPPPNSDSNASASGEAASQPSDSGTQDVGESPQVGTDSTPFANAPTAVASEPHGSEGSTFTSVESGSTTHNKGTVSSRSPTGLDNSFGFSGAPNSPTVGDSPSASASGSNWMQKSAHQVFALVTPWMYGQSARWRETPSGSRSKSAGIFTTRGGSFPHQFPAEKRQAFRRGHSRRRCW